MSLRLTPEDETEYLRRCAVNQEIKEAAMQAGDSKAAKKARQANTALYKYYFDRRIPEDQLPEMTVEERLDRIEAHLKLGRFADID